MYIFGEEPDISDGLTHKMQKAAVQDSGQGVPGTPDMASHSPADHSLPFELRMLDTALEEACKLLGVEVRGVVKSGKGRIKDLEMEKSSVCLPAMHTASLSISGRLMVLSSQLVLRCCLIFREVLHLAGPQPWALAAD